MDKSEFHSSKVNYKGEHFLTIDNSLFNELERIASALENNMTVDGLSHRVKEIIDSDSFNDLWKNEIENCDKECYSKTEFKGIYAFAEVKNDKVDFQYIGISRTIRRRFWSHVNRKNRGSATWAYLMAKHENEGLTPKDWENMIGEYQRIKMHRLKFTFVPIHCNMLLHMAEIYCVNKLGSHWNSFKTH